jgi:hypothetical protein
MQSYLISAKNSGEFHNRHLITKGNQRYEIREFLKQNTSLENGQKSNLINKMKNHSYFTPSDLKTLQAHGFDFQKFEHNSNYGKIKSFLQNN